MSYQKGDEFDGTYKSNCCGANMTTDYKKPPSGYCESCGDACWGIIPEIELEEERKDYEAQEIESLKQ